MGEQNETPRVREVTWWDHSAVGTDEARLLCMTPTGQCVSLYLVRGGGVFLFYSLFHHR